MSYVFPTYARWNITPEKGEGSWLTSTDGHRYLDFTSGIGVTNLGHRHPKVEEAIIDQLGKYYHTSNLFQQPLQEKLAKKLTKASGLAAAFFCNSGAEANEAAIKLAKKSTGRKKIVSCYCSFHGRTYATMGATGQEKVRVGYGPMLESFVYIPFNDEQELKKQMDNDTAAIILEIIQGEGGIHVATNSFLQKVQETAKKVGALIIIDEIQTGVGRTGKPFAYQHFDLKPDIVTVAKGLGNGLPIGAMIGQSNLIDYFHAGSHGSTFGGNPISVAAANAVLDICFEDSFLQKATEKGDLFKQMLVDELSLKPMVKDIRGIGLMIGIELEDDVSKLIVELQKEQLLVLPAGPKVMRLLPPLNVTEVELQIASKKIASILQKEATVATNS